MTEWSFLTNHARALVCIAHDPGVRLRDIAATVGITERSAYAIVTDLTVAGYVVKEKDTDGRRNRYRIQSHLPLRETIGRERTIGEVLDVLVESGTGNQPDEPVTEAEGPAPNLAGQFPAGKYEFDRPKLPLKLIISFEDGRVHTAPSIGCEQPPSNGEDRGYRRTQTASTRDGPDDRCTRTVVP